MNESGGWLGDFRNHENGPLDSDFIFIICMVLYYKNVICHSTEGI
jgi:hypothetical protein